MNTITIGIAGSTGSGKSTFTNRLKRYFGDRISVLYHDNYYKRQDDIPFEERVKVNYDHPDALETDLFVEHLRALKNGQTILCPVYDYTVHNRSDKVIEIKPSLIILVEWILVLYDPRVRDLLDIKVYVEARAARRRGARARSKGHHQPVPHYGKAHALPVRRSDPREGGHRHQQRHE